MSTPRIYVAGPMRHYPLYNFPAFDEAAAWLRSLGWKVISPAEIDRALGLDETEETLPDWFTLEGAMQRDLHEITHPKMTAIALLPGWVASEGSIKEVRTAIACGLDLYLYSKDWGEKRLVPILPENVEHAIAFQNSSQSAQVSSSMVVSSTGGHKGQKRLRYDLIPSEALEEVALCYGVGAENPNYGPNNWKKGYPYSASLAALERHLHAWKQGIQDDPDGFKHLSAVVFHALSLIYRDKLQPEWDDVHEEVVRKNEEG